MTGDRQAAELGSFLKARRMEVTPADVGLPGGGRRRVKGLRREEVAMLASISTDYYARIEQGRRHAPEPVLDAIARVLRLDSDEREYAFEVARASSVSAGRRARPRRSHQRVPDGVQTLMDTMVSAPAVVQNGRLDIVAANQLGRALYQDVLERQPAPANLARFVFLDPHAADLFPDWEAVADDAVAILRAEAGRAPYDKDLTDLIGELATRSPAFEVRWAAHQVRAHRRGSKHFHHSAVGDLTLRYEALEIPNSDGLVLIGFTAEPGSPSADSLRLLGSWAMSSPEA